MRANILCFNNSRIYDKDLDSKIYFSPRCLGCCQFWGGASVVVYSLFVVDPMWASTQENLSLGCTNNKGADQPAHPRRLISAFVIRFFKSIISKVAWSEISMF